MLSRRSSVAHSPSLRGATPASKRTLAPAARSGPRRSAAVGTPCRADLCVTLLPLSHHLLRRSIRIYDWRLLGWPGDDECAPQRDERVAGMLACTSVRVKGRGRGVARGRVCSWVTLTASCRRCAWRQAGESLCVRQCGHYCGVRYIVCGCCSDAHGLATHGHTRIGDSRHDTHIAT